MLRSLMLSVILVWLVAVTQAHQTGSHTAHQQWEALIKLRKSRNSHPVLGDPSRLYAATDALEKALQASYEPNVSSCSEPAGEEACLAQPWRPGNFHGTKKSHAFYVSAISERFPSLPRAAVESIVASEWYHAGLTAKSVWCTEDCGRTLPLAHLLDANFVDIQREVDAFWHHPDALTELQGVGSHTTQFDKLIAGNGTWIDVRLWRGRAFNKNLCERHFRVICGIIEMSPEVWTNPWSHVLLSVLMPNSWVPFHQGHTNGQLTYHLPVRVPRLGGVAELAVIERGGVLPDDATSRGSILTHPEEQVFTWKEGSTLVFDDSFSHAVRFRSGDSESNQIGSAEGKLAKQPSSTGHAAQGSTDIDARVILLMRAWHPELDASEREAIRQFIRRGGEEDPEGYDMLPIGRSAFDLSYHGFRTA